MSSAQHGTRPELEALLQSARQALEAGDAAAARRYARQAAHLAPEDDRVWLYWAAAAKPRAGLAYAKRALELNPNNERARSAIRWLLHKLVPEPVGPPAPEPPKLELPSELE
ncbi:MAG: hypothetical protein WBR18_13405, partial [Anaerolineales bacterium]